MVIAGFEGENITPKWPNYLTNKDSYINKNNTAEVNTRP